MARLLLVFLSIGFFIVRLIGKEPAFEFLDRLPSICPLKGLFGMPCGLCGMTHSFLHAAFFQWAEATRAHALSIPIIAGVFGFLVALSLGWKPQVPERILRKAVWGLLGILTIYSAIRWISE